MIFNFFKKSIPTNAKIPSAIMLSKTNFGKLPYEIFNNHMERGIYGPILNGSSSLINDFGLS
jgi:hypothetical protein